jgi:hypothetical protein
MALTTTDCVRAAIPDASDELCHYIIWGRTPYPFIKLTARDFYKAASGWRRAFANKIQLCDFCDRPAVDGWTCQPCREALALPNGDRDGAA